MISMPAWTFWFFVIASGVNILATHIRSFVWGKDKRIFEERIQRLEIEKAELLQREGQD
jgi:hypothetical protein